MDMLAKTEIERKWYVLICEPQMERKAAARIIGNGFKAYLPEALEWTRRGVRRTKLQISRPLFRGYLFVKLAEGIDPFGWVGSTVGVHKFLRMGDCYAVVPDALMKRIEAISEQLMIPTKIRGPSAIFQAGETVRVSEGPFSGLNADIVRLDDEQRITILLTLLGRAVPVTLEAMQLEKL